MSDDRRKARRRVVHGAASMARNLGEARGRDIGKRARLRTVGGDIGGGRSKSGRQAGTTSEKVRRVGVVWVQLLARAYIYSCYI